MLYGVSPPTAFEDQIHSHALGLLSREVGLRKVGNIADAVNDVLTEMIVQLL